MDETVFIVSAVCTNEIDPCPSVSRSAGCCVFLCAELPHINCSAPPFSVSDRETLRAGGSRARHRWAKCLDHPLTLGYFVPEITPLAVVASIAKALDLNH